jgi:hypothetical protein
MEPEKIAGGDLAWKVMNGLSLKSRFQQSSDTCHTTWPVSSEEIEDVLTRLKGSGPAGVP